MCSFAETKTPVTVEKLRGSSGWNRKKETHSQTTRMATGTVNIRIPSGLPCIFIASVTRAESDRVP